MGAFAFLMIAIVLAVAGAAAVVVLRGKRGAQAPCPKPPTDPYKIAYLAGGADGVIRIAIYQLCSTGLLTAVAGRLKRAKPDAESLAESDLDRAIVRMVGEGLNVATILKDPNILRTAESLRGSLVGEQLVADDQIRDGNRNLALIAGGVALAVTILGIVLNLDEAADLLIALVVIGGIFGFLAAKPPTLTPRGNHALASLRSRFQQTAKNKSSTGGIESLTVAALYGFDALPAAEQPLARVIFYKK